VSNVNILNSAINNSKKHHNKKLNESLDVISYFNRQSTYQETPVNPQKSEWQTFDYNDHYALEKLYIFNSFDHLQYFINEVLKLSEVKQHHPKIVIDHYEVNIALYTKDINDVTELDLDMSKNIQEIYDDINFISITL